MTTAQPRKLFLNLAVQDLDKSVDFFTRLGFTFNQQFTDENASCMVVSDEAYVMLLVPPFFRSFTSKEICDTATHAEALVAVSAASRADVDELVDTALASGGQPAGDALDQGYMYGRSFQDLDGHIWEVVWMDSSTIEG